MTCQAVGEDLHDGDGLTFNDRWRFNLGSGGRPLKGYLNVDLDPNAPGVNVVCDLNDTPWRGRHVGTGGRVLFVDNMAIEVRAHHVLEHLESVLAFMQEAHRVLRPDGYLHLRVPHFQHANAYTDPTHRRFFTPKTMGHFTRNPDMEDYSCGRPWRLVDGPTLEGGTVKRRLRFEGVRPRWRFKRVNPGEIRWTLQPVKGGGHP